MKERNKTTKAPLDTLCTIKTCFSGVFRLQVGVSPLGPPLKTLPKQVWKQVLCWSEQSIDNDTLFLIDLFVGI